MPRRVIRHLIWLGLLWAAGTMPTVSEPLPGAPAAPSLVAPAWSFNGSCEPIDFDSIDIQWYPDRGVYVLTVRGIKPYTNMEVSLSHQGYGGRPAYWRTLVIGCVKNFLVLPIEAPYIVTMPLDQFVGSKGVEIVGASRKVRRPVPRPK